MAVDLFCSSVQANGHLAAVFECDAETGYLYLMDLSEAGKIVGAIQVTSGSPDFGQDDIRVTWNRCHTLVGLFLHGQLWAAFNAGGDKFGGNYKLGAESPIAKMSLNF
jgi:hypothetical protein